MLDLVILAVHLRKCQQKSSTVIFSHNVKMCLLSRLLHIEAGTCRQTLSHKYIHTFSLSAFSSPFIVMQSMSSLTDFFLLTACHIGISQSRKDGPLVWSNFGFSYVLYLCVISGYGSQGLEKML